MIYYNSCRVSALLIDEEGKNSSAGPTEGATLSVDDRVDILLHRNEDTKCASEHNSRSQLSLDEEDEMVTERDEDEEVEEEYLLDSASVKDLILRLNRVIAREEVLEWDSLEDETDLESDDECLECEEGGRY